MTFTTQLLSFLKFRRLRRPVKERETGYYYVHWAVYEGQIVERLGYYSAELQVWYFPGDVRSYRDVDFITVIEQPALLHRRLPLPHRVLVWSASAACTMLIIYIAVQLLKLIYQLGKVIL